MARLVPNTSFIAAILLTSFVAVGADFVSAKPARGLHGPDLVKPRRMSPDACSHLSIGKCARTSGWGETEVWSNNKGRVATSPDNQGRLIGTSAPIRPVSSGEVVDLLKPVDRCIKPLHTCLDLQRQEL